MEPEKVISYDIFTISKYSIPDDSGNQPLWIEIKNIMIGEKAEERFSNRKQMEKRFRKIDKYFKTLEELNKFPLANHI